MSYALSLAIEASHFDTETQSHSTADDQQTSEQSTATSKTLGEHPNSSIVSYERAA